MRNWTYDLRPGRRRRRRRRRRRGRGRGRRRRRLWRTRAHVVVVLVVVGCSLRAHARRVCCRAPRVREGGLVATLRRVFGGHLAVFRGYLRNTQDYLYLAKCAYLRNLNSAFLRPRSSHLRQIARQISLVPMGAAHRTPITCHLHLHRFASSGHPVRVRLSAGWPEVEMAVMWAALPRSSIIWDLSSAG